MTCAYLHTIYIFFVNCDIIVYLTAYLAAQKSFVIVTCQTNS